MGPMAGDLGPIWISGAGGGLGSRGELRGSDMMVLRSLSAMLGRMGRLRREAGQLQTRPLDKLKRVRLPAVCLSQCIPLLVVSACKVRSIP